MVTVEVVSTRLDGWKEIAGFIKRTVRTTRRRARAGMPVYKLPTGSVVAYKEEILDWEKENAEKIR
jgi:hypothetical protein